MKLVGFKALIETGGVRSIEIFMSRTRFIGVGLVLLLLETQVWLTHSCHFNLFLLILFLKVVIKDDVYLLTRSLR